MRQLVFGLTYIFEGAELASRLDALDEAPPDSGPLRLAAVVALLLPDPDGARVTIRDHGPGIPPELEGRIFDPYCTGKQGGTGLGLALAKQTIELHRGTIAVERTVGGGATFVVRLSGL